MGNVFLYGRHSTDKQDLTEDIQRAMCLRFFHEKLQPKGLSLAGSGWYYDAALSSENPFSEREQGRIVFLSAQPGDHVVIAKWSRAFRSLADGSKTMEQFHKRRVTLHVVDLPVDNTRANGRLVQNVQMSVDQYYREIAIEAQYEVMNYRLANGLPYSRGVPVGWKVVGAKPHRRFQADQQERVLCALIEKMRAEGQPIESIALWCFRQDILPNKRRFGHVDGVRWALLAHRKGYPKISGFKRLRKMAMLGQV